MTANQKRRLIQLELILGFLHPSLVSRPRNRFFVAMLDKFDSEYLVLLRLKDSENLLGPLDAAENPR